MKRWLWLLLTLAVSVASAGRLTTFTWGAGSNWPTGTTVELCGNGNVCQTGLTGTRATLDLPVQPGDVIQGRARAVAPTGYQCGIPPAPCPYSSWATVAQTWPLSGIGLWARYGEYELMSVERTGTYIAIDASANTGSQSISIPSDATIIVVGVGGYEVGAEGAYFSTGAVTVNSVSLTVAASFTNLDAGLISSIFYLVSPATGTQTVAWDWAGTNAANEGGKILIAFYKGVDTTNPIKSSSAVGTTVASSITTGTLTAATGDAVFAYACTYGEVAVNWTNATEINEQAVYNSHTAAIAEAFPSANLTVTATRSSGSEWNSLSAVVLAAGASAATALPRRALDGPLYGSLRGSVR